MANRFYMGLSVNGDWHKQMKVSGAQLAPYRTYLETAKKAASSRALSLAWREPTAAELKKLEQHLHAKLQVEREKNKQHAKNAARRRDRLEEKAMLSGHWVMLESRPNRSEEPNKTFDAFLEANELCERRPVPRGNILIWEDKSRIDIIDVDSERRALYLSRLPTEIPPPDDEEAETDSPPDPEFILFLRPNTWPLDCQIKSLRAMEDRPSPRIAPLLRLVSTRPEWSLLKSTYLEEREWVFLQSDRDGSLRDGTEEQRNFVSRALATPDFAVLEGPPGSGKTTAICELIVQLMRAGKRVLLVASTHVAVDNVLERLIAWQDNAEEKLALPIRIGDEKSITVDTLNPWILRNLLKTWHSEILDYLDKPVNGTLAGKPARVMLQSVLTSKEGKSDFAHMLLEASNLVCGTIIGILQHPAIKATGKATIKATGKDSSFEPFDYMILDEASKTTFSEFLVPAAYAKRWVVVGDTRQLSPYVDEQDLAENINALLPPEISRATVHTFMASEATPPARRERSLIAVESDDEADMIAQEAEARKVVAVDLDNLELVDLYGIEGACQELLYADIVFGDPETIAAWEHRLPSDLQVVVGKVPALPCWQAHHSALKIQMKEEMVTWAGEVAWRQIRAYELRHNQAEKDRYVKDLAMLLPMTLGEDSLEFRKRKLRTLPNGEIQTPRDALEEDLENMRRVSMPSILEILQSGAGSLGWRDETALTQGLPKAVLDARQVSLSYQHRMHPEISIFPREQFYITDGLLQDAAGMSVKRNWEYARYAKRAVWLDIQPAQKGRGQPSTGNSNPAEVDALMEELKAFGDWAATHPRQNQPWEVAVLTFYRGQETELRTRLQKLCHQPGNSRNFQLPTGNVHITLCTVDSFQGHETDLVLLSFVKSGSPGFLNSPNRLNVALTRARYQLVLIGHRGWMVSPRCKSELLNSLGKTPHYSINYGWNKHD